MEFTQRSVIGGRVRRRRQAMRLTLKDVSSSTGLTEGFLSQLERGVHAGSVTTLQKICGVLALDVGDLFASEGQPDAVVNRFVDNQGFSFGQDARKVRLTPAGFDHLEVLLGLFEPHGSTGVEAYTHGTSDELLLVVHGTVDVTVGSDTRRLDALDSMVYNSAVPHRAQEAVGSDATILWAIAPPTY